jgi:hypothetical protein
VKIVSWKEPKGQLVIVGSPKTYSASKFLISNRNVKIR